MLLEKKDYEMLKVKTYLKSENFTFLSDGVNRNPRKLLKVEQDLKALGYCSYKVLNRITLKTLNDSIYPNVKPLFTGLSFIIRPFWKSYKFKKNIFQKSFEPLLVFVIAIKVNNKVYSKMQIENLHSIKYNKNKLVFCQFLNTNLKNYCF